MGAVVVAFPSGCLLPLLTAENGATWCMERAAPQSHDSIQAQPSNAVRTGSMLRRSQGSPHTTALRDTSFVCNPEQLPAQELLLGMQGRSRICLFSLT